MIEAIHRHGGVYPTPSGPVLWRRGEALRHYIVDTNPGKTIGWEEKDLLLESGMLDLDKDEEHVDWSVISATSNVVYGWRNV